MLLSHFLAEILDNQHVFQQSLLQVMTDITKIKAALVKSNLQETDDLFQPTKHTTMDGFIAFCDTLTIDPSKRDLFVSNLFNRPVFNYRKMIMV